MEKLPKSQLAKISLVFLLLLLTPFVPISLRTSYLYFLFNILIIALGVEAGLLAAISSPCEEKKAVVLVAPLVQQIPPDRGSNINGGALSCNSAADLHEGLVLQPAVLKPAGEKLQPRPKVEKAAAAAAAAVAVTTRMAHKVVKRCPSKPSIFYIGGCEGDGGTVKEEKVVEEKEEDQEEEFEFVAGELSKQELFAKAELFIGNFYKQLKMQREESWKKIHGLYHRPF